MKYYIYYIITINIISILLYKIDKELAKKSKSRISERTLFFTSLIGAPLGSLIGMKLFHHKTKKIKFYIFNILLLCIWLYISYRFYIMEV